MRFPSSPSTSRPAESASERCDVVRDGCRACLPLHLRHYSHRNNRSPGHVISASQDNDTHDQQIRIEERLNMKSLIAISFILLATASCTATRPPLNEDSIDAGS